MAGTKMIKLQVYQHSHEETVIDQFEAEEYDDFMIIRVRFDMDHQYQMMEALEQIANRLEKRVIAIPYDLDIEFYGVKEDD